MRIAIVGWGVEGQSAFRYFGPEHDYLIVNEEPRTDFPAESERVRIQFIETERTPGLTGNVGDLAYLKGIENCDKVIYSVTTAKNLEKVYGQNADFWAKATTIQHIFFEKVKTKNIVGVTGTKGKGTTSTLIYELLKACGKTVYLGGNIGTPVLDFVDQVKPEDWVVLELSNFQLYKLDKSPHIAVGLMIVPEHMDWHPDMEDYAGAKANLFKHQNSDDVAIYFADNEYSKKIAETSPGQKIPYFEAPGAYVREDGMIVVDGTELISKSEVKLLGEHNLQNICAALTAVWFSLSDVEGQAKVGAARKVLQSFSGLEHRLEFVRELDGVKYYDDSFGTTPETAIVAIKAFDGPKVVILGGSDKGADYDELAQTVKSQNVRKAVLIGATAPNIQAALEKVGFTDFAAGGQAMPEIVRTAKSLAQSGDVVLLSTACASFGLFKDYKDRGNQFKQAVLALV